MTRERCEPHGNLLWPADQPFPAGDSPYCRVCWRAAGGKVKPLPLPCVHVGQAAGPAGWHVCEHEAEPLGMVVCTCKGCGPKCPGYTTATAGAAT